MLQCCRGSSVLQGGSDPPEPYQTAQLPNLNRDSPDFLAYDNIQPEGLKNNLCTSSSIEKDPVFLLPGVDQRESNLVENQ